MSGENEHRAKRLMRALNSARDAVSRSFEAKIRGVGDHKGALTVTWAAEPTEAEKAAFSKAWDDENEDEAAVGHVVKPRSR